MLNLCLKEEDAYKAVNLLENTENWNELERKTLEENKLGFSEELLSKIQERFYLALYFGGCYSAINPQDNKTASLFPGLKIEKEGITYNIHGIQHYNNLKKVLKSTLKNLENVICEATLNKKYALKKAITQTRSDECKYLPYYDYWKMFFDNFSGVIDASFRDLFQRKQKQKQEIQDFRKIFDFKNKKIYVEDIHLPKKHEDSLIEIYLRTKNYRPCLIHSLSQTEFLIKTAKKLELKEIHGIYGLMHELEISYFLRNPDKLNKLKEKFKPSLSRKIAIYSTNAMKPILIAGAGLTGTDSMIKSNNLSSTMIFLGLSIFFYHNAFTIIKSNLNWRINNKTYRKSKIS